MMKALDLKMRMGVLTEKKKEKYEKQFVPKLLAPEDAEFLKEKKLPKHRKKVSPKGLRLRAFVSAATRI